MPAPLAIIIPTLNAAAALPETAEALLSGATEGLVRELAISDGGSTDETRQAARELGAIWVEGPRGRGGQIARGIAATSAPWLLVLHADTHLSDGWTQAARDHMNNHPDRAGFFRLRFRAFGAAPRLVEAGANLRARWFGLPFGDQGLLIRRDILKGADGYPDLPLMEDVALARRLGRKLRPLDATANTSAERYIRDGWSRRVLRNLGTQVCFHLGASPETLLSRYHKR